MLNLGSRKIPSKMFLENREKVEHHILSYNPNISHYRRVHAPHRKYLPSDIKIKDMHANFLEEVGRCSYSVYYKVLKSMHISFARLGHEECEMCEEFFLHGSALGHSQTNLQTDCEMCDSWYYHIQRAGRSRAEYTRDKENVTDNASTKYVLVDLQKVIQLPRMKSLKREIFVNRIVAYNESFVAVGSNSKDKPFAVLWHEGITGRDAENIASTYRIFITHHSNREIKNFVFWVDNCVAQNKNWTLLLILLKLVNSNETAAETFEIKFIEPGHTFMSADSFHHFNERRKWACF